MAVTRISKRGLALTLGLSLIAALSQAKANYPMRIGFEDVVGVHELASGDLKAGVAITEKELRRKDAAYRGRLLANLCGAYVLQRELTKARKTCRTAIRVEPNETAYNNRGVLRALTGDIDGAREDFEKARPADPAAYLEELKQMDARFMADENFAMLNELATRFDEPETPPRMPVTLAIEEL